MVLVDMKNCRSTNRFLSLWYWSESLERHIDCYIDGNGNKFTQVYKTVFEFT